MTKKDLFRLIIKIIGLFLILSTLFTALPSSVSWLMMELDIYSIIWVIFIAAIIFLFFMFLTFKPDKIIKWLKLDQGFDSDNIEFQKFNNENILKLAVIVIGGILLIDNIPAFLTHTLFAFHLSIKNVFYGSQDNIKWLMSFINILIGYLMLRNYSYISRILKKGNEKNEKTNLD
jgi:hypothetical protein